jgi:hypothetical protein
MKMRLLKRAAFILGLGFVAVSCNKKLDVTPVVGVNPANVYDNVSDISAVMAKVYGGYTLSGSSAGACDLGSYDPGTSVLYRMFWCAQELTSDEVKIAWNDGNLPDYNTETWNANNDKIHLLYDRLFYQISVCNEFIRNLPASKVSKFNSGDAQTIRNYVAEARFLRAMTYWMAIDFFGDIPFATETASVGTTPPKRATRTQVFNYITSELNAIDGDLLPAGSVYGRADKGCEYTLLAKLYLNSAVYTGTAHYDSVVYFCKKVMAGPYALAHDYGNLFKIDNKTTSKSEIIFPLQCNGVTSQSYGNSTFLVNAQVGNKANPADFGTASGWAGYRATPNLVNLFPGAAGGTSTDARALFDTVGQTLEMPAILNYPNGYALRKFYNTSSAGTGGSNTTFADLDIPFFRYADVLLMYAEASLQGGGGTDGAAVLNQVRARANAGIMANVTVDSVLAERGREMYCEGTRRTDLIRFNKFAGGSYLWPWKGGAVNGTSIDAHLNVFPIPTTDLNSNPNLIQNAGY